MENEKNWIWIVAVVFVLLLGACSYYWCGKKKQRGRQNEPLDEVEAPMDELDRVLKRFAGNFGALWRVACGQTGNAQTVYANIDAIVRYASSVSLQQWWDSFGAMRDGWDDDMFREKAGVLLGLFARCGLEMGGTGSIVADEATRSFYVLMDEGDVGQGETVNVLLPYWKYKEIVIEKGLIIKEQTL